MSAPNSDGDSGRVWDAWLAATRQELAAPTETQEKTLRHDLRGHAAYVIGMCHLWRKQAAKHGLERFVPDLERLETAAGHVVTLLDKLVSFKRSPAPSDA